MTLFYYNYQNPSDCCFLVKIRAIVFLNPSGIGKFKYESKNEMNSVSCGLLPITRSYLLWNLMLPTLLIIITKSQLSVKLLSLKCYI